MSLNRRRIPKVESASKSLVLTLSILDEIYTSRYLMSTFNECNKLIYGISGYVCTYLRDKCSSQAYLDYCVWFYTLIANQICIQCHHLYVSCVLAVTKCIMMPINMLLDRRKQLKHFISNHWLRKRYMCHSTATFQGIVMAMDSNNAFNDITVCFMHEREEQYPFCLSNLVFKRNNWLTEFWTEQNCHLWMRLHKLDQLHLYTWPSVLLTSFFHNCRSCLMVGQYVDITKYS